MSEVAPDPLTTQQKIELEHALILLGRVQRSMLIDGEVPEHLVDREGAVGDARASIAIALGRLTP